MHNDPGELWRLRRFSLGVGLVLLTWSLAGVTIGAEPRIAPLGLPLQIARPDLVPVGLALAAVYGTARYFYYALSFGPSPYRVRRELLDQLRYETPGRLGAYPIPATYLGATEFSSTPSWSEREKVEQLAADLRAAFPKFARARVQAEIETSTSFDEDGDQHPSYSVKVSIPLRCRIAAVLEDIDYTAPVWFPIASIAAWGISRGWFV
jgi:hypothetical protein